MKAFFTILFVSLFSLTSIGQERMILTTSAFDALEIGGSYTVFIRQGNEHEVVALADDFEDISWEIEDGTLRIDRENESVWGESPEIRLYITVTTLREVDLTGAVTLESKNRIDGNTLEIEATGASTITLDLDVSRLSIESTGASDVTLKGKARYAEIELTGASSFAASELEVDNMDIECSGASSANLNVTSSLSVEAHGASTIYYTGDPEVESDVSTASELIKR